MKVLAVLVLNSCGAKEELICALVLISGVN